MAVPSPAANANITAQGSFLRVDIGHFPLGVYCPTRDRVKVLAQDGGARRDSLGLIALSNQCGPGRLHVAGLIRSAALQDHWLAVPVPRHTEPGQGLAEHRRLKR